MSALAINPVYAALLAKVPPRVIRSDGENEAYLAALYELEQRQDTWGVEEGELADLLTLLIENYEEKHCSLPRCSPIEMVEFLMEQQGLEQSDMTGVFGTATLVSEVFAEKRDLTTGEIRLLSERFAVSPEMFF